MHTNYSSKIPSKLAAILMLLGTAPLASSQVIISDSFDRNGNLGGSTTEGGGVTWVVGNSAPASDYSFTTSTAGGGGATSSSTNVSSLNAVAAIPSQYLTGGGGTLASGVYQLTVTMADPSNMPATGNQGLDVGLGHFSNDSLDPWNVPQKNDNLFFASVNLLTPPNASNVFINGGPHLTDGNSSGINSEVVPITQGSTNTFVLTLDATGANTPWTLSATLNGSALTFNGSDTMTYKVNGDPLLTDTGFYGAPTDALFLNSYGVGGGTFTSLSFQEIPEPSTYALIGVSVLALLAFRRRRLWL
jgi:hypothetical protein